MMNTITTLFLGVGVGVFVGWFFRGRLSRNFSRLSRGSTKKNGSEGDEAGECSADSGEYKLVLVVNNELKMGKGKVAAQCAHAAVSAVHRLSLKDPDMLYQWHICGQPKVVVKTESAQSLRQLADKARSLGLAASIIRDAGRTQIAPGSQTVLGVGPGPEQLVNEVTGHLKLF